MNATFFKRRNPVDVMRLARLGSLHQCRLSFMRTLTRRMAREGWQFIRTAFEIDAHGVGHAVYTAKGPERSYSLVAFAHDLPAEKRSDRVIAEAWDATFSLFDGVPSKDDIARLWNNVPLQEAGRVSASELSLSRANRSVRLWAHIVDALANGQQPDPAQIDAVGYLMRTTAVYGSGKFGASDREKIADRPEMTAPFQAEMLSVYLTRWFVRDLVQHTAQAKGGAQTATLDPAIAQRLGIGNSTGLGMAPFLINHPMLLNNWILAREEAIARVRSLMGVTPDEIAQFTALFERAKVLVERWRSEHPIQIKKLEALRADLAAIDAHLSTSGISGSHPWNGLVTWAETALSAEGQELICSLILEPYGEIVDGLSDCMADQNAAVFAIQGAMPVAQVRDLLDEIYGWTRNIDWQAREHQARAWYVSEEKLEPRLGERFDEPIAEYEQPLAPARDAAMALAALDGEADDTPIASFLLRHPEHRHMVRRAQISAVSPYSEISDNTISAEVMPIDMLRAKLSFFGATHFDPRSDRWVRICMFAGAPYPQDLTPDTADYWVYPEAAS